MENLSTGSQIFFLVIYTFISQLPVSLVLLVGIFAALNRRQKHYNASMLTAVSLFILLIKPIVFDLIRSERVNSGDTDSLALLAYIENFVEAGAFIMLLIAIFRRRH